MNRYSAGFKAKMVQLMAGPEGISANALSQEMGVSQGSLSRWLANSRMLSGMSKKKSSRPLKGRWTADRKMQAVLDSAGLSEEELGEFLRRNGLHEAQLQEWRAKVTEAGTGALKDAHRKKSEQTPEARKIRELESELRRKEKALAEAAALLVLKKNVAKYYEEKDSGTPTRREP